MNKLLSIVLVVFAIGWAATAKASYGYNDNIPANMQQQDNGLWLNVNDQGQNDGWYYDRVQESYYCNGCCYTRWAWKKAKRVATLPNPREDGFDEKYLNALTTLIKWRRNEKLFDDLKAFAGDDGVTDGYTSYTSTRTIRRGRGYTANGQTYGYYERSYPTDDYQFDDHNSDRALNKAFDLVSNLSTRAAHRDEMALEFQKNLMAYKGFKDMLERTPSEETVTTERSGTKTTTSTKSLGSKGLAGLEKMLANQGKLLNDRSCLKCHSGATIKKDFDVTQFNLIAPDEADDIWAKIEGHLRGTIQPQMPYSDGGKAEKFSEPKIQAYKAYYYSQVQKSEEQ